MLFYVMGLVLRKREMAQKKKIIIIISGVVIGLQKKNWDNLTVGGWGMVPGGRGGGG